MAKRYDQFKGINQINKLMDQTIKKMEEHNLAEVEIKDLIYIKKGRPEDAADQEKTREISEERRKLAERVVPLLPYLTSKPLPSPRPRQLKKSVKTPPINDPGHPRLRHSRAGRRRG